METKTDQPIRPLASQSSSFRLYEDDFNEVAGICRESGRRPAEELRDLITEALRARRQGPDPGYPDLVKKYEQLVERNTGEKKALSTNMREFYGLLLEAITASLGARNMAWNYVAYTVLKQSKFTDEQIRQRYEAELKACIDEREQIAEALEQAVNNPPKDKAAS
jgi:hypothetical protein